MSVSYFNENLERE